MDQQDFPPSAPGMVDLWQRLLPYALLVSITFALYSATLYFNFIWDDSLYVFENFQIQGISLGRQRELWSTPYLGNYAPLQHLLLAVIHSLSGLEPFGYHLAQLLLHASCVCLLYFVLQKLESPRVAFLAAL